MQSAQDIVKNDLEDACLSFEVEFERSSKNMHRTRSAAFWGGNLGRSLLFCSEIEKWLNSICTSPRSCYDESKRYKEALCVNFVAEFDLPESKVYHLKKCGPGLKITDPGVIPDIAVEQGSCRGKAVYKPDTEKLSHGHAQSALSGIQRSQYELVNNSRIELRVAFRRTFVVQREPGR